MMDRLSTYLKRARLMQYASIALAKGGAMAPLRSIDPSNPASWEFSGFSQNGEDGILDFLTRRIQNPTNFFLEIGASFGTENNTSWLAIARRFSGVLVEGDPKAFKHLSILYSSGLATGVICHNMIVTPENAPALRRLCHYSNPDVLSVDIDGFDFFVVKGLFEAGFRPSITVVEYNSAFGPEQSMTVPYEPSLPFLTDEETRLYYGVSITGWRNYFETVGYQFVCVETNGVNAFFVNPAAFDSRFLQNIRGLTFRENNQQLLKCGGPWQSQFELIKGRTFVTIP
jgi:hypothetical protein